VNEKREGRGVYAMKKGVKYEGTFVNNLYDGKGKGIF
jgi:hypothetical protein